MRLGRTVGRFAHRGLPAGVINGVIRPTLALADQLGDGDDGIALSDEELQNPGQGFGRVLRRVMEEDDGAGLHLTRHPFCDLVRGDALPVKTVIPPSGWSKPYPLLKS